MFEYVSDRQPLEIGQVGPRRQPFTRRPQPSSESEVAHRAGGLRGEAPTDEYDQARPGAAPTSAMTDTRTASCAGAVSWKSAGRMVGRVATVRGPVVSTKYASYSNGSPTFLNLGAAYPSSKRFTVVIWGRNRASFRAPETRVRASLSSTGR